MPSYPSFKNIYNPCMTYTPPGKSKIGDFYKVCMPNCCVCVDFNLKHDLLCSFHLFWVSLVSRFGGYMPMHLVWWCQVSEASMAEPTTAFLDRLVGILLTNLRWKLRNTSTACPNQGSYIFLEREGKFWKAAVSLHALLLGYPKPINRCEPDREVNFSNCLSEYIEGKVGCRLPWRRPNGEINCQQLEEMEKYENISKELASLGDSQIVELTRCQMSCSQTKYTSRQVSVLLNDMQILPGDILSCYPLTVASYHLPKNAMPRATLIMRTRLSYHGNMVRVTMKRKRRFVGD